MSNRGSPKDSNNVANNEPPNQDSAKSSQLLTPTSHKQSNDKSIGQTHHINHHPHQRIDAKKAKSISKGGIQKTASSTSVSPATTPTNPDDDYKLLLNPLFAAMTKITDNLFLTGVGGMTKENFRKNHIDFVVNITTEAPFWQGVESMRVPLEDDQQANILPHLDMAVERIHEEIAKKNSHVLVHCVAGVSRSAAIVIAYLMKFKKMDLKSAFNMCYNERPVIRPNNGFMAQLINYEYQLHQKHSVVMVDVENDGVWIKIPNFFVEEHPKLVQLEVLRVKAEQKQSLARKLDHQPKAIK